LLILKFEQISLRHIFEIRNLPKPSNAVIDTPLTPVQDGTLTRRASLTFVSSLLQQGARVIVGIVVTPTVVRGLGPELYGVWVMLQQTVGYLSLSDLRPMATLKFTLGVRQHLDDVEEKRRQVGAAMVIWAVTLPILLAVGAIAVWAAPSFIRTDPQYIWPVRFTMALLVLSIALDRALSLPANVLRGVNLDYKAMGLNAGTILLGGLLTVLAIWAGWGLPGVAGASVLGIVLSGGVRYLVARRVVSWFGMARPLWHELKDFARLSGWLFISALGWLLLFSSDFLVVGWVLGPKAAAVYAITGTVLRMSIGPLEQLLSSGSPGIVGICGRGEWDRVGKVRLEMHLVALAGITVVGVGVVTLNQAFLSLWLGEGFFGGQSLNFLLVLTTMETIIYRVDGVIVDAMLEFRAKTYISIACGAASILLGGWLASVWGLPGMALGIFLARLGSLVYLPRIIAQKGVPVISSLKSMVRPYLVAAIILVIGYFTSSLFLVQTWLSLILSGALLSLLSAGFIWLVGLSRDQRAMLLGHFITLFPRLSGSVKA
jgi:O-antigen/teichoic acid export membrane protein